ncbi:MAG TPA: PP2C family serine/threonine-protein phosphatase [Acidimicrobiales bacterium]|nr:PP2C family serine/threonine-protein phosphatase [Acidimicrobiales bacterium]
MRVVGASVTGSGHRQRGRGCDDAHHVVAIGDDSGDGVVLAVADGAGSARLAAVGAETAVVWAAELAAWLIAEAEGAGRAVTWPHLLTDVLHATRGRLQRRAVAHGARLADLSTTLSVAVLLPDVLAVAQVGDGAVVVRRADGVALLDPPGRSEYLNETCFVTSDGWRDDLRVSVEDAAAVTGIALMTDGLQLLALDLAAGRPHEPFFTPLWDFAAGDGQAGELESFLASDRVAARTDDDTTLVLAVR